MWFVSVERTWRMYIYIGTAWFETRLLRTSSLAVAFFVATKSQRSPETYMYDDVYNQLSVGLDIGPLLYIFYTANLSQFLVSLGVTTHQYADDTQAWVHWRAIEAICRWRKCFRHRRRSVPECFVPFCSILVFQPSNRFRPNPEKTGWPGCSIY